MGTLLAVAINGALLALENHQPYFAMQDDTMYTGLTILSYHNIDYMYIDYMRFGVVVQL